MLRAAVAQNLVKKGSERGWFDNLRVYSTETIDAVVQDTAINESDSTEEEDIERKRNKSRLSPHHRNILYDKVPYSSSQAWYHDTVKYKRRLYGRYGSCCGVYPGLMWPTAGDLEDIREYESVAYPETIKQMMQKCAEEKRLKEAKIREREENISKKMESLEKWKTELNDRILKKEADAIAAKARKDRLIEEVRRHFGFKVDPRDDRFKEMLEKKEKEEKKLAKEAKRKAREAKAIARLTESVSRTSIESKE